MINVGCGQNNNKIFKYCLFTAIHGAKTYGIPVALTSRAVASPIFFISTGSLINSRSHYNEQNSIHFKDYKTTSITLLGVGKTRFFDQN